MDNQWNVRGLLHCGMQDGRRIHRHSRAALRRSFHQANQDRVLRHRRDSIRDVRQGPRTAVKHTRQRGQGHVCHTEQLQPRAMDDSFHELEHAAPDRRGMPQVCPHPRLYFPPLADDDTFRIDGRSNAKHSENL